MIQQTNFGMKKREPSLFILLLLVSFASVSAVLFTPALPEISRDLGITTSQAQLTISLFLIGFALGSLPYGPISNRYGRKTATYIGLTLAMLGSLLIALSHDYQLFLLGRFLTALGSSVGMKIAFTMIGDVYDGPAATKKISYMMLSFAIGPGAAIAIGGFLTTHFGWNSCFYFLIGYSLFMVFMTSLLPETIKERDMEALNFAKIKIGYLAKFKNKKLVTAALLMGGATSFVYLFASEAPFIAINQIGLSEESYGYLNFIPPIGMIAGTFLTNGLARRETLSVLLIGITISLGAAALMLALFLLGYLNRWTLFIPMPFLYIGLSLIYSNASATALSVAKNKSNASAVMNSISVATCVVILFAVQALNLRAAFVLPLGFLMVCLLMLPLHQRLAKLLG